VCEAPLWSARGSPASSLAEAELNGGGFALNCSLAARAGWPLEAVGVADSKTRVALASPLAASPRL